MPFAIISLSVFTNINTRVALNMIHIMRLSLLEQQVCRAVMATFLDIGLLHRLDLDLSGYCVSLTHRCVML